MKIISYGCGNYKPFKDNFSIELRPLTLIYGKNSSGKSASLRVLRLLLRALSARATGAFPLKVDDLHFGANFRDFVHGKLPHGAISFSIKLEIDGEVLDLSATVQNIADSSSNQKNINEYSVVSHLELRSPVQHCFNWIPAHGAVTKYENDGPIVFRGLLPDTRKKSDRDRWQFAEDWRERIQTLEDRIEHLGPHRTAISSIYEITASNPLEFDGSGTPCRLAMDDALLEQAATWYQSNLDGWRLSINKSGNAFECTLTRGDSSVNLADAGQGMQQALPVIIQQLSHQLNDDGPFIDLIEQPELHLHTAAQAPLGDLFLDTAKAGRGQVIVETHSENLLLRIRRRIAEGADPNLVGIYWIDDHADGHSTVRRIEIDKYGELDWWREGIFSEGYEEVRAIRRAARARREQEVHS